MARKPLTTDKEARFNVLSTLDSVPPAMSPQAMSEFQSYDDPPSSELTAPRIAALRALMKSHEIAGFLVPRADKHQGEYVAPCSERLAWISGFTGSAGLALVLVNKAALFVDGRYTLQAAAQVDESLFSVEQIPDVKPTDWLKAHVGDGAVVAYDPWLLTLNAAERFRKALSQVGARLQQSDENLIDLIWTDRPEPPLGRISDHPLRYAGESAALKLDQVKAEMAKAGADFLALTDPASIAWLFNIRGSDIPHNPIPLGFALIAASERPHLFIDERKLPQEEKLQLDQITDLTAPLEFAAALAALPKGSRLMVDADVTPDAVRSLAEKAGVTLLRKSDPVVDLKAIKNSVEQEGARQAHLRDGVAVTRFLAWLDAAAPTGTVDEIQAARQLETFRRETGRLKDSSFDTISGAGPHGAIIHYRVTEKTNAKLTSGSLYLVDSGGQYQDGTTDITRTIAIGEPTNEMQRAFTLVLKGLITLTLARFPKGTTGAQLDSLARQALWSAGFDYDHGTGHGVGSYLCVHEGPAQLSKTGSIALKPGMILSNEPGYYKADAFGIRIETLVLVREATAIPGGDRAMMGFETLTLAPIDRRLVLVDLLSEQERGWLNDYHARVRDALEPLLDEATTAWLIGATQPI